MPGLRVSRASSHCQMQYVLTESAILSLVHMLRVSSSQHVSWCFVSFFVVDIWQVFTEVRNDEACGVELAERLGLGAELRI
jgi:hypothetical protein